MKAKIPQPKTSQTQKPGSFDANASFDTTLPTRGLVAHPVGRGCAVIDVGDEGPPWSHRSPASNLTRSGSEARSGSDCRSLTCGAVACSNQAASSCQCLCLPALDRLAELDDQVVVHVRNSCRSVTLPPPEFAIHYVYAPGTACAARANSGYRLFMSEQRRKR